MCKTSLRSLILVLALFVATVPSYAQEDGGPCGPLSAGHYGPFDYRTAHQTQRSIVENAHFRPETFSKLQGITGQPGGDINYTLRAFPNHHRALDAMMRLAEREGRDPPARAMYTVECYFERAIRFRRDDLVVRMQYANYLLRKKRPNEAVAQLDFVTRMASDNPMTHFNAGLLYADAQVWDKALAQAHRAAALGFPRQDLQQRLREAGKWAEPAPESSSEAGAQAVDAAAAASAASR
jgi:hypothetical protein